MSARQEGLKLAEGRYVINVDGDDILLPNTLDRIAKIIKKNEPDIITIDSTHIETDGKQIGIFPDVAEKGLYTNEKLSELKKDYSLTIVINIEIIAIASKIIFINS